MVLTGISRWRRARRYAGGLVAFTALAISGKACSDLTAPTGVNAVTIQFRNLPFPRPDTLQLIVGDSIRPDVVVMLGSIEQERARFVFSSSDPSVIKVFANGDSITVENRGSAALIVSLVGTTIGKNNQAAGTRTADTVIVVSAALTNSVTPATVTFDALGAKRMLDAQSFGRDPNKPIESDVVWRSVNPAIASVDAVTGEVTSVGNGTTDIYAIFEGVDSTFSRVTVLQQLKRYILTTPTAANLRSINETMTVSARAVDSLNNTLGAGATAPPPPAFVSDNPGKVEIDPASGVMTARGNTTDTPAKITATVGGATRSDTLQVTVSQVAVSLAIQSADTIRLPSIGDRVDLNVLAPDALGTQVPPSSITWTSADPSRAQVVGSATGTITAQGTGTVVVRARADQQSDSVVVVITNDPDRVTLSPKPFELKSLDETRTLTATVTNAAGTPLSGIPVSWLSRDSSIAEPQATEGVILARAIGETRIVVSTNNGRSDSVTVRVTNAPDTVNIIPATLTFASIDDVDSTFAVNFKNARGVALPRTAANWSSQDLTIARVLDGAITAVATGTTYIVAVSPENALRRDSVRVTVTNAPASVTVSPATPPDLTALGATRTFTATVRNAAGDPISGASVTWSVPVGGAFVSIDPNNGVATALANGTATIRGTSGGVFGEVDLTVGQVVSTAQSTIIPAATSLVADGTSSTLITIQLKDANGNNLTFGGATVVPSVNRGTLSGLTDNGGGSYTVTLTSGTAAGPASVSATVGGQALQNTGLVSFTAGPASQYVVTVSPTLTPLAGAPVTISARLADANGNSVATGGNVVSWSSTGGGSFSSATSTTDGTGLATVTFTTNNTATQHTVTATTGTFVGTSPVINTQAGGATQYLVTPATTSPAAGSGVVISAQLLDGSNNPVALAGQTVTWSKSDANGSFSSATSTTNSSGVATVTLTAHTVAGTSTTVTATSTGPITGTSPAITTVAAAAAQLVIATQPSATVNVGIAFAQQPEVQLLDAFGNLASTNNTTSVTATRAGGSGSLLGMTTVTATNGVATFTNLAHNEVGTITIQFTASGLSSATSDNIVVNGPTKYVVSAPATAIAGETILVTAQLADATDNPAAIPGKTVTWSSTGAGGSFATPTSVTNSSGRAEVAFRVSTAAGMIHTVTASDNTGLTGTSGDIVIAPGVPQNLVANSATSQTATVFTDVAAPPSVIVRDQNNNPVGAGVDVTFTLTATGGTGGAISPASVATVTTDVSGVATLTSWTLGQTAGTDNNTVTATISGLNTITFTASGTAGTASIATSQVTANPTNILLLTGMSTITIQLRDQFNNVTSTVAGPVTLTTNAGTLQGGLVDNGNGNYTQALLASALPATATLTAFINGVAVSDTATVTW